MAKEPKEPRERKDSIPTSRVSRTARIGSLAAGQAIRQAGTRAANVARSPEGREAALERRHIEAAEQIVAALGTMKGAAMKVGQVLSFLDVGMVPEEYREEFQHKLAALRDAAPTVTFKDMRKVIEEELGERLSDVFEEFDQEPIAAASIGQVYRARLLDGREVAVKVQYPGVGRRGPRRHAEPGPDPAARQADRARAWTRKAIGEEIRSRIQEELDYELEAQNQRTLARIFRGHPFIVIPDVITSLSHERMMVSEYVAGHRLRGAASPSRRTTATGSARCCSASTSAACTATASSRVTRTRATRMLLDDGRMAFYDFGLFKRMPPGTVELEINVARAVIEGDTDTIMRLGTETGFFPEPEKFNPDRVLAHFRAATSWYTADREIELTPEYATQVLIDMSDPRSEYFGYLRHESAPPDHIFGRRMEVLTLAVLSQLHARGNFHRIAREWFYDDPPTTELGRQEAEFYSRAAA